LVKKIINSKASVFLLKRIHDKAGILNGWSRDRVKRCCAFLNVTVEELAARSLVPFPTLKRWMRQDKIPPYIALLFYLQERSEVENRYD
tara:strand:- start:34 stop:300 length:267 start_codon:yes stop_codon:yes gene_type:complete